MVGRAGVAPATQEAAVLQTVAHTDRRADLCLAVQMGLEPTSHTLERRAARPLRFCTIDAVQVEKAVDSHTGIEPALTVFETVALPFGEYVSFFDEGTTTHRLGFEPRTTVLETGMLPLHHLCIGCSGGSRTRNDQVMSLGLCH